MFYQGRIVLNAFKHADIQGVSLSVTSRASPDNGHCRAIIPFVNTLRPRQNGRHFTDDTFKRIFMNENVRISIKFSLKFVPKCPFNNIPALVLIMAWRRPGDKPLSELMMVSLLTHICVTRPQWVKGIGIELSVPTSPSALWQKQNML